MAMRAAVAVKKMSLTRYFGVLRFCGQFEEADKLLKDKEKAAENIYIQKMERESLEKQKLKLPKERPAEEMEKVGIKAEGTQKG